MGIEVPPGGAAADNAPKAALLAGFKAAQWLNFAFIMVGLLLVVVFMRGMGIIANKHVEADDLKEASEEERREIEKEEEEERQHERGTEKVLPSSDANTITNETR